MEIRKHIGVFSPYLPPEIIWACGLIPVRLRPGPSLSAADGYLPRNFSVEARALLAAALDGNLSDGSGQDPEIAAAVFLDDDDTSRRFFDVWHACAEIPALGLVALPRLNTPPACRRYAEALAELAGHLSDLFGQPLTTENLLRAMNFYNQQRALLRDLRQRWVVGRLSTGDWYDCRWLALTTDPVSANACLATVLNQTDEPGLRPGINGLRLLILGGMHIPRRFLTFLEGCGARVVAEDSEADERTLTEPVLLDADPNHPMDSLASAYLNKTPGPRANDLSRRLAYLLRLLEERQVQGVMALYTKFADAYLAEYLTLAECFRARGLPSLLLEDDGESGFSGQQRTRIEAFLEVLA